MPLRGRLPPPLRGLSPRDTPPVCPYCLRQAALSRTTWEAGSARDALVAFWTRVAEAPHGQ